MTDVQEDKLGMFKKVSDFLTENATDLSSVTQIADKLLDLNKVIDNITDYATESTADNTGFTIQKQVERVQLEKIVLKVSAACGAYFLSINNFGGIKLADYTKSEVEAARDNDLYVKAKQLYKIAQPVEASLTAFNSGPADVADLNTKKDAFFNVIQLPADKRDIKTANTELLAKKFEKGDNVLIQLDIYMNTFAATNEELFLIYTNARNIDNSGGGSQNTKQGSIAALTVANAPFAAGKITADSVLKLTNTGSTVDALQFYFSSSTSGNPEAPITSVTGAAPVQASALSLGYDPATRKYLNIFNPDSTEGKWKVQIVE